MSANLKILSILALCAHGLNAQFDPNVYLGRLTTEAEVAAIQKRIEFLRTEDVSSPFVREVEVRARMRDLETSPDDYRFRLSPLNPAERKANQRYFDVLRQQFESEKRVVWSNILTSRYLNLIRLAHIEAMERVNRTALERYQNLIMSNNQGEYSGKERIRLEKRVLFVNLDQSELKHDKEEVAYLIGKSVDFEGPLSLAGFNLISPESIARSYRSLLADSLQNVLVHNEQQKVRVREAELEVNEKESFGDIGFVQAEYRGDNGNTAAERLGFQVGVSLPIVNPDRPDLQRRRLELIEEQYELTEIETELEDEQFAHENLLKLRLRQYQRLDSTLTVIKTFDQAAINDVETLLEIEDFKHDLEVRMLSVYEDLLIEYIGLLEKRGLLVREPLINYLSENGDLIQLE